MDTPRAPRRRPSPAGPALALAFGLAALLAGPAAAGTICGTVRDALTAAPVARAGIFARTPAGDWTGAVAASDAAGAYCLDGLAPGVYDLEVRHDDYETRWVRGVVVTDGTTGVDPALGDGRLALLAPAPNPARTRVTFAFRAPADSPARLAVHDLQGRLVRAWQGRVPATGAARVEWDLSDHAGARARPALYFVRLETRDGARVRRFQIVP